MAKYIRLLYILTLIGGSFPASIVRAQTHVKPGETVTQLGEQLQMQCGDFKVVLTCRHSDEIATRQRKYPRLCNDNTLTFIKKDGSSKVFGTYESGRHRDKTPVDASCQQYLPINKYLVSVPLNDTAATQVVLLNQDAFEVTKRTEPKTADYNEIKSLSRVAIREVAAWQQRR